MQARQEHTYKGQADLQMQAPPTKGKQLLQVLDVLAPTIRKFKMHLLGVSLL